MKPKFKFGKQTWIPTARYERARLEMEFLLAAASDDDQKRACKHAKINLKTLHQLNTNHFSIKRTEQNYLTILAVIDYLNIIINQY